MIDTILRGPTRTITFTEAEAEALREVVEGAMVAARSIGQNEDSEMFSRIHNRISIGPIEPKN